MTSLWQWSTVSCCVRLPRMRPPPPPPPPLPARPLGLTQPLSLGWFLDFLNADFLLKDLGSLGILLHLLGNMGPSSPVPAVAAMSLCIFPVKGLLSSSVWLGLEEQTLRLLSNYELYYKDVLTQKTSEMPKLVQGVWRQWPHRKVCNEEKPHSA